MRSDRYTKVVLTVIALALAIIALPRLAPPEVQAAPDGRPETAVEGQDLQRTYRYTPVNVGPLRWRIGFAGAENSNVNRSNECFTSVSLLNTSDASIDTEVVFYGWEDLIAGGATETVPANGSVTYIAYDLGAAVPPFNANQWVQTGQLDAGFALVYADDPRILTSAFFVCSSDKLDSHDPTQALRSVATIPAYPVGVTAEYFLAGMPTSWPTHAAAPETSR